MIKENYNNIKQNKNRSRFNKEVKVVGNPVVNRISISLLIACNPSNITYTTSLFSIYLIELKAALLLDPLMLLMSQQKYHRLSRLDNGLSY